MSRAPVPDSSAVPPALPEERVLLVGARGRRYGVRMEGVREVIPVPPAYRLPGADEAVLGLINVRGRIVTTFDLATALGGTPEASAESRVLLVEHRARLVGVRVEEVRRLVRVDADALRPAEPDAAGPVYGIGDSDGETFEMLDLDALLAALLA